MLCHGLIRLLAGPVYHQTGDLSYVRDIRQRMEQDQVSRREREKRRRKILTEQLEALQQQQEANRENLLVERLMRQCVQEKRIATQLMQIRKEKEVIRNNRLAAVTAVLGLLWYRSLSLCSGSFVRSSLKSREWLSSSGLLTRKL